MPPQHRRKRATLASLAQELGVSRTTVSNAYNRPDQLSEDLRLRILEAAQRVGYAGPDPVARSLRIRQSGALGLLLTEELQFAVRDAAAAQFLSGLAESCGKRERGLLLLPAAEISTDKNAARVVHHAAVDGFVIYSVASNDPYLKAVLSRKLPTVVVDQPRDLAGIPSVSINDYAAMKQLADYVFDLGHTRIALLTIRQNAIRHEGFVTAAEANEAKMHVQRRRIQAVLASAEEHGVDPASVIIVESFESKLSSGHDAAELVYAHYPECTALVCTSDALAMGALLYARSQNTDVPGDVSIAGFDGIPDALEQDLTTIIQPSEEKGFYAGELVFAYEKGEVESKVLPTSFHRGSTVGPPRQR